MVLPSEWWQVSKKALRALLILIFGTLAESSLGCRFNVRETGFVDLGMSSYLFLCYTDDRVPGKFVSAFEKAAESVLDETNVGYEFIDTEMQSDHPALKYLDRERESPFPYLVLLSPQGSAKMAGFQVAEDAGVQSISDVISKAVDSPLRDTVVQHLSKAYGVVLLIEGEEVSENERANGVAEQVIAEIEAHMQFMPKEITNGPVFVTLKRDAIPDERVLLWSLGLEGEELSEPHLAVLYGKGRWIGPVLRGVEIEEGILFNILSVIGADCECGLDPRLIRGMPLPVRWVEARQAEVAKELGFDPENPMVKMEVSQILKLRGTLYPTASSTPREALDDLPVPFVEDRKANPLMKNVLFVLAGILGLVAIVGFAMVKRARKRDR